MFQRSRSPKPPKPSRAETEYLRAIMADVTAAPVTNSHPFGFLHHESFTHVDTDSLGSSSSAVPANSPGSQPHSSQTYSNANALANNLWMRLGQLPLPGVEECLKMFTSVEVLDGENMVGCRRCWKIANGWYEEGARAERREERRKRREQMDEESDDEPEEEDDEEEESDEDGRDGDESGVDDDDGDDEDFSTKASEESTTTEDGNERRLRQTSSAPASPSILPHPMTTSMLYAHQNVSDGFSLTGQVNGDSIPVPSKPVLTVQPSSRAVNGVSGGISDSADNSVPPSPTLLTARPGNIGFAAIKGEYIPNNIVSQSKDSLLSSTTSSTGVDGDHYRRRHDECTTPSTTDYSSDDNSDTTSISTAASVSVRSVESSAWTSVSPAKESTTSQSSSSVHNQQRISAPAMQISRSDDTSAASQASSSRSSKPKKSKLPKPTIMRPAYKRYLISTPPPILVIHLKRFQQVSSKMPMMSFSSGFKKLDDYVTFPEFLDLTPFMAPEKEDFGLGKKGREVKKGQGQGLGKEKEKKKPKETKERFMYRLYAVVVHIGNMLGGHYIAYTALPNSEDVGMDKTPPAGIDPNAPLPIQSGRQWAYISDTVVRFTTLEEVLKAKAYICMSPSIWHSSFLLQLKPAQRSIRPTPKSIMSSSVVHTNVSKVSVDGGIEVFYREAGDKNLPAPDMPGFGFTAVPKERNYKYTFDNIAKTIEAFTHALKLDSFAVYIFDYGAPTGLKLALARPTAVKAIISQNGNAFEEGLGEFWAPIQRYWAEPTQENREKIRFLTQFDATKWQYVTGEAHPERIPPETYYLDQTLLDRPGNADIQLDLFLDYQHNVTLYPAFHEYFRTRQPPLIAIWGKNDQIFVAPGAEAFKKVLPNAVVKFLDGRHFPLENHGEFIGSEILQFLEGKF
ncbi:hypothetical protein D9758_002458 [Tetrapyrgos nigripes]|uniref:USP domain-containing protein n=1 Tax=Tetrapyrgos nigripes TaxID=182062 RepID=A0A8H5GPC7_9AGAR|nr:hypothetical protein D9758_002458 [Tetrapyrgos nigripes]